MSLPDVLPIASYSGNASTSTVYPFPFKVLAASHVKLYIDGVLSTDAITVTGVGDQAGVDVTTSVAYTSGQQVTLRREVPLSQETDLVEGGRLREESLESALDYGVMQAQQLNEELGRTVQVAPGGTGSILPSSTNSTIGQDSNGDLVSRTAQEELDHLGVGTAATAAAASAAAAAISETNAGASETTAVASAAAAEASNVNASAAVLDLASRSFPVVRIGKKLFASNITSDVALNFPGGGVITLKASARPYTETNAINAENVDVANILPDIINIINGDVTDADTGTDYGLSTGATNVDNFTPITDWSAELATDGGTTIASLIDLTYYGSEQTTFTVPLPLEVKANATLAPPADLPFNDPYRVSGTYGDGASHPASGLFASLAAAQAVYPRCLSLTEELDGLAIQKAIDSRKAVMIPAGRYKLSTSLKVETQGQHIYGESMTRTILTWVEDVDGIQLMESTESTSTNLPGSSALSNSWGRIENLAIYGPASSTKKGISNVESASPTLWVGEGWRIDFVYISSWQNGIYSSKAARYNCRSLVIKDCVNGVNLTKGTSDSNNCHNFYGLNCSQCDVGVKLFGLNTGVFHLQDFAYCGIGVEADQSNVTFDGGELESYTTTFFDLTDSRVSIRGARFLGGTSIIPIVATSNSFVDIQGCEFGSAGGTVPIASTDITSKAMGWTVYHMFGSSPGGTAISKVRVYSVDAPNYKDVYLSPFPWSTYNYPEDGGVSGLLYWRPERLSNGWGMSDIIGSLDNVDGDSVRASVFRSNNFGKEFSGSGNITPQGWEDVIILTNAGSVSLNLGALGGNNYQSSTENLREVTIINEASSGTKTINAHGTESFYGVGLSGAASFVLASNESARLLSRGNGRVQVLFN